MGTHANVTLTVMFQRSGSLTEQRSGRAGIDVKHAFRSIRSYIFPSSYLWTGMQYLPTHSWVTLFTAGDSRAAGYCIAGNFWNDSHIIRSLVV